MDELRYVQKSSNLFDPKISSFVNSALLLKEIETKIAGQRDEIPENDPFCEGKISNLESEKAEQLESLVKVLSNLFNNGTHKDKLIKLLVLILIRTI